MKYYRVVTPDGENHIGSEQLGRLLCKQELETMATMPNVDLEQITCPVCVMSYTQVMQNHAFDMMKGGDFNSNVSIFLDNIMRLE